MAHNFVLLAPKTDPAAFAHAATMARATDFVPADKAAQVLASSKLAGAGETVEVTFAAPKAPGVYTYICTFPGHFAAGMKGTLTVNSVRVAVFSTRQYDRVHLDRANAQAGHALIYFEHHLDAATSQLARGFEVVSAFVNDRLDAAVLRQLAEGGTRLVALRCAGFNQVDLAVAAELGVRVVRVPAYSPYAVAEHTIALILALNRHIPRAVARVRDGNFALDGLVGFDLHGKTAGVVGTGTIGTVVVRLLHGFGCRVLACDPFPSAAATALGATYTSIERCSRKATSSRCTVRSRPRRIT